MKTFGLEIVTPDGLIFSGEAESVTVKTTLGDVSVLAAHADYFAALATGPARIKIDGSDRMASLSGGYISVEGAKTRIVATTFEFADEIDKARAEKAKEKALSLINSAKDDRLLRIAKAKLARALTRIEVSSAK